MVKLFQTCDAFFSLYSKTQIVDLGYPEAGTFAYMEILGNKINATQAAIDFVSRINNNINGSDIITSDQNQKNLKLINATLIYDPVDKTYITDDKNEFDETKKTFDSNAKDLIAAYNNWLTAYEGHPASINHTISLLFEKWFKTVKEELEAQDFNVGKLTAAVEAEDRIYQMVEQDPMFPDGQSALLKYIAEHIQYPEAAKKEGIQGRVKVDFVIKSDGSIGDVKITRGQSPDLDKEAIRVIKSLPKFIPGKINGRAVNCWYSTTITFRIDN